MEMQNAVDQLNQFFNGKVEDLSFAALLERVYQGDEPLRKRLIRKLNQYEGGAEPDSVSRNVRNWLSGQSRPQNREDLFKICFALALGEEQAQQVLCAATENGLHYRSLQELTYTFCLRENMDYPQACALMVELTQSGGLADSKTEGYGEKRNTLPITLSVRDEFKHVETTEQFRDFIKRYCMRLGNFHNTAYRKFSLMLRRLLDCGEKEIWEGAPKEKAYGIERVVKEYLRLGVPYEKKTSSKTRLQREIKRHWPSPKSVQEMYARKRDVDRKTLMLLYLATEGMDTETKEAVFLEEHYRRLDLMLSACGMASLDMHRPFDYLVIQSLHVSGEDDFMSQRMRRLLCGLFREEEGPTYISPK